MLSDLVSIEDNDWDSVRQAHGAYARDLKRIFLSLGLGGDDMGGGVPKSANDQTVAQDGSYGYPVVTTDMLDALEDEFNRRIDTLPTVRTVSLNAKNSSSISVTGAGANACSFDTFLGDIQSSISGGVFTAPYTGVYTICLYTTSTASIPSVSAGFELTFGSEISMNTSIGYSTGSYDILRIPTATLSSETWPMYANAVWAGRLSAGNTVSLEAFCQSGTTYFSSFGNILHITGVII